MKRRTVFKPKLRDRRAGISPYQRYGKRPYDYRPMYRRLLEKEPDSALAKFIKAKAKTIY